MSCLKSGRTPLPSRECVDTVSSSVNSRPAKGVKGNPGLVGALEGVPCYTIRSTLASRARTADTASVLWLPELGVPQY